MTPQWHRGVGAGVFLIASIVRINLDIARGLKTGHASASVVGVYFLTRVKSGSVKADPHFPLVLARVNLA